MGNLHTIPEWEQAIEGRTDIVITEMRLERGKVTVAGGYIISGGSRRQAFWMQDGACYCTIKDMAKFNIHFPEK